MRSTFFKVSTIIIALLFLSGTFLSAGNAVAQPPLQDATATADGGVQFTPMPLATSAMDQLPACPPTDAAATATDDGGAQVATATTDAANIGGTDTTGVQATSQATQGPDTAYVGVFVAEVADCGLTILTVTANSPAEAAGLLVGDVIVAVDGTSITDMIADAGLTGKDETGMGAGGQFDATATADAGGTTSGFVGQFEAYSSANAFVFFEYIQSQEPGDVVTLTVIRGDHQGDVPVTLGRLGTDTQGDQEGAAATATADAGGTGGTTGGGAVATATTDVAATATPDAGGATATSVATDMATATADGAATDNASAATPTATP
jgi:hypothetical protein